MSLSVAQFMTEYNGKFVKSPHGISGQCVSVPSEFAVLNGWPELWGPGDGTALEIWNNGVGSYTKVLNQPDNAPVEGDFLFFGADYGGGAGHVVLVESATVNEVTAFEQNDPDGSSAHTKVYTYGDAEGWFHYPLVQTPQSGEAETIRDTYVRSSPNLSAPLAGSKELAANETFDFEAIVPGQLVTEDGVTTALWYESTEGNYIWSGNAKTVSTNL